MAQFQIIGPNNYNNRTPENHIRVLNNNNSATLINNKELQTPIPNINYQIHSVDSNFSADSQSSIDNEIINFLSPTQSYIYNSI